jgi:hypothetical protein
MGQFHDGSGGKDQAKGGLFVVFDPCYAVDVRDFQQIQSSRTPLRKKVWY